LVGDDAGAAEGAAQPPPAPEGAEAAIDKKVHDQACPARAAWTSTTVPPKAMAAAMPDRNTNMSAASLTPKRAGMKFHRSLPRQCAMKMMNMALPRKKSSRGSRVRPALAGTNAWEPPGARIARLPGAVPSTAREAVRPLLKR